MDIGGGRDRELLLVISVWLVLMRGRGGGWCGCVGAGVV